MWNGGSSKPERIGYFLKRLRQECENVAVYVFHTDSLPNLLEDEIEHGEFMALEVAEAKIAEQEFIPETTQLLPILRQYLARRRD